MKLVVFSICKDEAETIGQVLDDIPQEIDGVSEIDRLVVSDGSIDDTVGIAKEHGANVIDGKQQKRLAYRFEQALDWVLSNGADLAVNIDGDMQFNPKDIPQLLEPILKGDAEFVVADRFTDPGSGVRRKPENMPANKYHANRVGSSIVGMLSGYNFRDVTCGFRAYNRDAMLALNINNPYTYTQESFQLLAMKKFNIDSVPIEVKYYPGRQSRVVTSFFQFLMNSTLNIVRAFRDFAPLKFFFWLGFIPFIAGLFSSIGVWAHWAITGQTSPYTSLGIIGVYLVSLALVIWVVGLVADMMDRNNKNQEKLLELSKRNLYDKQQPEK